MKDLADLVGDSGVSFFFPTATPVAGRRHDSFSGDSSSPFLPENSLVDFLCGRFLSGSSLPSDPFSAPVLTLSRMVSVTLLPSCIP